MDCEQLLTYSVTLCPSEWKKLETCKMPRKLLNKKCHHHSYLDGHMHVKHVLCKLHVL